MPLVTLETRRWMAPEQKKQAFDAVHAALVSCFRIPDHDRHQRMDTGRCDKCESIGILRRCE